MKAKMSQNTFQNCIHYGWDIDDITDIACGEFLFQYGDFDDVEIVEATNEHIKFKFHNEFAKDIYLQMDTRGNVAEVNA